MISFSLLTACGVPRPDADLCQVDADHNRLICYNLKNDYSDEGKIKPEAKPHFKAVSLLTDLDKYTVTDPKSWSEIRVYLRKVKERYRECKSVGVAEMESADFAFPAFRD